MLAGFSSKGVAGMIHLTRATQLACFRAARVCSFPSEAASRW